MTRLQLLSALLLPLALMALLSATGHRSASVKVAVVYGIGLAVLWTWGKGVMERSESGIRPSVRCPHCHSIGQVYVSPASRKKGVSGGKATAGILTGGVSLLFVGLSRKQSVQECECEACGIRWDVA